MFSDEFFMQRCIELAQKGLGSVAPNPMVGCVIVHDNRIIGEGYHRNFGEAHAEVMAINSVSQIDLLEKATLYVSLEPCAHHGKTPPCVDLILEKRIPKVVIGCRDSYHEVNGKGIQRLQLAGVEVVLGLLETECKTLNKRFFTFHNKKRPYIVLKWAQTRDGYIDRIRSNDSPAQINRISSEESKTLVHLWRSEEQAILVGKNTVLNDNPELTVRAVSGKNPIRIVLDPKLELSAENKVFNAESPTLVLNLIKDESRENVSLIRLESFDLDSILEKLHELQIQSILVEGGAYTLQQFIDRREWDEARVLVGDTNFGKGLRAPIIPQLADKIETFFSDKIHYFTKI